ncbi:hypothetical protein EST92_07615 [Streptomyces sp. TM32]|uniref:hypothetical protein n=1 Tax=Streptomyces sp. TM32 TaxID=1652669 RepID=UPI0010118E51|nr:hypothetical protein [Streptomyces sp. TM32]RXS85659.1 hypothetical protein EST92_07615 [Streptomyces sp. TM32]
MSAYHSLNSPYPGTPEPPRDPAAEERIAATDRLGDELLERKTARQDEVTREIYDQLRAGSQVDDIKHLIARLSRAGTEDAANRPDAGRARGGRP